MADILAEYDSQRTIYEEFAKALADLLPKLLTEHKVRGFSVELRRSIIKERSSLERKIQGKAATQTKAYEQLSDITDIIGLRVITDFEDNVNKVLKVLESEFEVDKSNSMDKGELLDPNGFGYRSVHYVVALTKGRSRYGEYKRFKGLKSEIQVRSILQHAWAEIEHDIGYHSPEAIPRESRRQFSRLAGLLELADEEFIDLRNSLNKYKREIRAKIKEDRSAVLIDADSITSFVNTEPIVGKLDAEIAKIAGTEVLQVFTTGLPRYLLNVQITNIGELHAKLSEHHAEVLGFFRKYSDPLKKPSFHVYKGFCLIWLCFYLISISQDEEIVIMYLDRVETAKGRQRDVAKRFIANYKLISHK